MMREYSGINIQWPISTAILDGSKTIETRHYPIPAKYLNCELLIIETPGKSKEFKARIVGIIVFSKSEKYDTEEAFYQDVKSHLVDKNSKWKWVKGKSKWAWYIANVKPFSTPIEAPSKKGIRFTNNIQLR